ncbi:MAG TPA: STAS/SEC14 domain-containing protein [Polyangiaceae bacterium]|nr:STAS/SEC14 domain-containing protein [Polyangiaceae bacterium]
MLEMLSDVPEGIVGLKAIGKLTHKDYETVFVPLLDGARREGRRLRLLYEIGPEFEGFTPAAAWEDAKLGLRFLRLFVGCAVVTDREWARESARIAGFLLPCPVRVFANRDRDKALEWLGALPRQVGVSHRLLTEKGVVVIDAKEPLHTSDFDALALTVDPWIESHGVLEGVVIHARAFPGWENLGSLVRHVQFVRDHHRYIKRIALATDAKLAGLAPRLGQHFVRAEIKTFEYDQIDAAVAWASGPPADAHRDGDPTHHPSAS